MLFLIGACLSSFTQLVSERWGKEKILFTRSRCTFCHKKLQWFLLIPIVSFLLNGGKCFYCKHKLPYTYLISEILGALLFYYCETFYYKAHTLPYCLSLLYFFVASQIDYQQFIVPNSWQLCYFIVCLFIQPVDYFNLFSALMILLAYLAVNYFFPNQLGAADAKLLAITSFNLGIITTLYTLLYGCIFALIYYLLKQTYQQKIPFVPFLFLGLFFHIFQCFPQFK